MEIDPIIQLHIKEQHEKLREQSDKKYAKELTTFGATQIAFNVAARTKFFEVVVELLFSPPFVE